ncbi:hypothetical protein ACFU5O_05505 [Streptomyces sp. NPDC057445]|uniref:hypothetical protein n=1 Tax=Streptomyces sp. NPDC057445 TaxID=3346136 RepID=UPI0036C59F54
MTLPRQTAHPDETVRPTENRRHMIFRRWLTAITIVLLVGVPAGYLVISAEQSRDSGRDKERESSATGMRDNWPSKMKRRVFEVPIPAKSTEVAYYETSNWKSSRLYVTFRTTAAGLDLFLNKLGTSRSELRTGEVTIGERDASTAGWTFPPRSSWSGTTHRQKEPRPTQHITADLTDPSSPLVFVVSTATP